MIGIETLSEPVRVAAALGSWEDFESKRVLMDLYAARAALAQARAALEATTDHESLQGAAEHEKDIFKHFGKTIPKVMKGQMDAIEKFEDLILDYTKANLHHEEALGHPDITDSVEQHLVRRAELFSEAAQAAMRDILGAVSKETMMVKHAVPKILDAIKASEESQIGPEFDDDLVVAELPPEETVETEEVVEVEAPEGEEREEAIAEEAEEIKMAADLVSDEGIEPGPTSDFALTLSKIADPLENYFKKNTTVIEDAFKASEDALRDYERAIKGAGNNRVASQQTHGFDLTA